MYDCQSTIQCWIAIHLGDNLSPGSLKSKGELLIPHLNLSTEPLSILLLNSLGYLEILFEIHILQLLVPTLQCDNIGATYLFANLIFHAPTKQVDIVFYFFHDKVARKDLQMHFIYIADIMIRDLSFSRFMFLHEGRLSQVFNLRGCIKECIYIWTCVLGL